MKRSSAFLFDTMFKLSIIKKKFTVLITTNLFFSIPLLYLKSTADSYIFIKYIFFALNIIVLLYINSIYNKISYPGLPARSPLTAPFLAFILTSFISIIKVENLFDFFMIISNIILFYFLFCFLATKDHYRNIIKIITKATCLITLQSFHI